MSEGVDLTRRQRTQFSSVDSSLVCGSEWSVDMCDVHPTVSAAMISLSTGRTKQGNFCAYDLRLTRRAKAQLSSPSGSSKD